MYSLQTKLFLLTYFSCLILPSIFSDTNTQPLLFIFIIFCRPFLCQICCLKSSQFSTVFPFCWDPFFLYNKIFQSHLEELQVKYHLTFFQIIFIHVLEISHIIFNYCQLHYHSISLFSILNFTSVFVLRKVIFR